MANRVVLGIQVAILIASNESLWRNQHGYYTRRVQQSRICGRI